MVTALPLAADVVGGVMFNTRCWIALGLLSAFAVPAMAQSFRVQCPTSTITHPVAANNNSEPAYPPGPGKANGAIKCQQIAGGDGYATMADGTQTYLFSFGPLSGLNAIANGMPGTEPAQTFMTPYDPSAAPNSAASNGAVGLALDPEALALDSSGNNP